MLDHDILDDFMDPASRRGVEDAILSIAQSGILSIQARRNVDRVEQTIRGDDEKSILEGAAEYRVKAVALETFRALAESIQAEREHES